MESSLRSCVREFVSCQIPDTATGARYSSTKNDNMRSVRVRISDCVVLTFRAKTNLFRSVGLWPVAGCGRHTTYRVCIIATL